MQRVRVTSVEEPFAGDPVMTSDAVTLLSRASVMGCLPEGRVVHTLDIALVDDVFTCLAERDVASQLTHAKPWTATSMTAALHQALEASEHSPVPAGEWPALTATLGEDLLGELLHISASSLRRYARGTRVTPVDVAGRLHTLALLVADLTGSYNDYGIRRWFHRPRAQLEGRTPAELLAPGWDDDGPAARQLRGLAASLVGAGAT